MSLGTQVRDHVAAVFPCIWIKSIEHDDAEREITVVGATEGWSISRWDLDRGFTRDGQPSSPMPDPLAAIHMLRDLADPSGEKPAILIVRNLHRFIASPDIVQAIDTAISEGKTARTFLVVLAPSCELPPEIERQIVMLEHDLPTHAELESIARLTATNDGELPESLEQLRTASAGLTRLEAEGAYSLSLVRHGRIEPNEVWDLKAQAVKKTGALGIYRGTDRFDDLGGMAALKSFARRALRHDRPLSTRPRGVLLLGVPGTGKSMFSKALGCETGRPTLTLDLGSMFGSLVGQTEERMRRALAIADAMAPAVLFIDEIEKGLAGSQSSGQTDSGVTARLFGTFLTWLNDHESDVFLVATSNNIAALPPEFSRAERFDGIFFLDFPTPSERSLIWDIHTQRYDLADQSRPRDDDWTGAEIASCCRLAALLGVSLIDAATNVVPISATAGDRITALRTWANGRCLASDRHGIYTTRQPVKAAAGDSSPRRNIKRPAEVA